MKTIKQIFTMKNSPMCMVAPDTPALTALRQMEANQLESMLVVEGDHLVGMMTAADYARKAAARGKSLRHLLVRDIMETKITPVSPDQTCEECIEMMTRGKVYCLPVVQGQRVLGMITMQEVVQALMVHQQGTIRFLEDLMLDFEAA